MQISDRTLTRYAYLEVVYLAFGSPSILRAYWIYVAVSRVVYILLSAVELHQDLSGYTRTWT